MKIQYIQPYSIEKNIGGAINQAIDPSGDWMVLMDHDILWLRPDSKAQLEHILTRTEYDILGPVTNRLAQRYQLVQGMFDEPDITVHIAKANELHSNNYGAVYSTPNVLAAFCLCFRVSVWEKFPFLENSLQFDSHFSISAKRAGYKLGIMPGIYIFHLYRFMSLNPTQHIEHLLPTDEG
jgi:glycosyltransferase involved in cell wall biosynthesis